MDNSRAAVADRIDVKTVMASLEIKKSLFYERYTKDCRINPIRVGNQSYISGEEFELLKAYHLARISGKDTLAEFLDNLFFGEDNETSEQLANRDSTDLVRVLNIFKEAILPTPTTYQKLSGRLTLLEQYASSAHARLSNIELSQILELSPNTLHGKKEYCRLGFLFRRDRQGWQVLIPSIEDEHKNLEDSKSEQLA